jgi:cellulose biosynthesis protein BcsQ
MRSVAVFSIKGGVGKTAVAVNLAHALATRSGRRTLIWDLDAQGAASDILQATGGGRSSKRLFAAKLDDDVARHIEASAFDGLDILPADRSLRNLDAQLAQTQQAKRLSKLLKSVADAYDRVVLDCPPGLGLVAEQVFRAADLIVEPMTPSPLSVRAHEQLVEHLARHHDGKPPVMSILTMVDRRRSLHREAEEGMPEGRVIPYASSVEQMAVHKLPQLELGASSPAARAFTAMAAAIEKRLGRIRN